MLRKSYSFWLFLLFKFASGGLPFPECHKNVDYSDAYRTAPQIIESRGYIAEVHNVITSDGYILGLHRVVNPLNHHRGKPVILQHGILDVSATWLMENTGGHLGNGTIHNRPLDNMLGFELARRGYDVWLPNVRGNTYSRRHIKLDPRREYTFQGIFCMAYSGFPFLLP